MKILLFNSGHDQLLYVLFVEDDTQLSPFRTSSHEEVHLEVVYSMHHQQLCCKDNLSMWNFYNSIH